MTRPVTAITLTQAVADHLRRLIHRGDVAPGERLPPERELAEQLGVARISLREAIKVLREDGYLEVRRGSSGGTYVSGLSRPAEAWRSRMRERAGEIDDILDFRIALETESAALAAQRWEPADLVEVDAAVDTLRDVVTRAEFRQADSRFHIGLARAARSDRLQDAIQNSRGELFIPRDLLPFEEPVAETLQDHRAIAAAVRSRTPERASTAMREHLERSRHQLRVIVFGADETASTTR